MQIHSERVMHLWFFPRVELCVMLEVPVEDTGNKSPDLIKLYAFSCECSRSFTKVTGAWVLTAWTFQPPKILIRTLYTPTTPESGLLCSSSSIRTTARCGLWSVEQNPSILSYLSPTPSIFSILFCPSSLNLSSFFPLFDFRNNKFFTVWGS
jgi:hypothetical protein